MKNTSQQGFTLVEVLISVALFGLISLAGFVMVDTILRTQDRTEGRLERLGDLQQALMVINDDLSQTTGRTLTYDNSLIRAERFAETGTTDVILVSYQLQKGTLLRQIIDQAGRTHDQVLVTGISDLDWSFYVEGQWREAIPAGNGQQQNWPEAVRFTATLSPDHAQPSGTISRTVLLPARDDT